MSKPNIFNFATKELSQDAFFSWLLQWGDNKYQNFDIELNEISKEFINLLIGKNEEYKVNEVEVKKQWRNIDISVKVNNEFFIVIEDKTNTGRRVGQLENYKNIAKEYCNENNYKPIFIYLKTGNESLYSLKVIEEKKGYKVIDRKSILTILNNHRISNDIFQDFKEYLTKIENETNSFYKYENIKSNWRASEGFYCNLQENIDDWSGWDYVPNQSGGFLAFFYYWREILKVCKVFIQIENHFDRGIKLVIKVDSWDKNISTLYNIFNEIKPYALKNNLLLNKPRFRVGNASTLAIIDNAFMEDKDGNFDFNNLLNTLDKLEKTIDSYCSNKTSLKE